MGKKINIRPGKFQSTIGFIVGCVFCIASIYIISQGSGIFGIVWTLFAILFTISNGIKAFAKSRSCEQSVETEGELEDTDLSSFYTESEVEERLLRLKDLFDRDLITEKEYTAKKKEILRHL